MEMMRIPGRKEGEIKRLVRGDGTNTRSEGSGSAIVALQVKPEGERFSYNPQ